MKRRFGRLLFAFTAAFAMLATGAPAFAQGGTSPVPTKATPPDHIADSMAGPPIGIDGCSKVIVPYADSKYVSARMDMADYPLQSIAGTKGSWESFCIQDWGSYWTIKSQANNKYVSARQNLPGHPLQAVADSVGPWEKFEIWDYGTLSIQSMVDWKYVSANLNVADHPLQASADAFGAWEKFYIGYN